MKSTTRQHGSVVGRGEACLARPHKILMTALIILTILTACTTQPPPSPAGLEVVTAIPTLNENDPAVLCETMLANWSRNWNITIRALERLRDLDQSCAGDSLTLDRRLYNAYIGYGTLLEQRGRPQDAIRAYQQSLEYNFAGAEAVQRLRHLQVFTPEPPPQCDASVVGNVIPLVPEYTPTQGEFVQVSGSRFVVAGETYAVHGINYHPREYPFGRFLTQANIASLDFELELMQTAGINTLRIFIRHDDLFICPGNGAIPVPANLARLDDFIHLAARYDYRLIIVLNHEPDLITFPLYESPAHTVQQMTYIASRYRDEPAVMAYDLRDNGDVDYLGAGSVFSREQVLTWLAGTSALMKQTAPNQLITAGWGDDAQATAPLVDFVSFQHFGVVDYLRQEIAILRAETSRPILLAAIGFNTTEMDEITQRQAYQQTLEAANRNELAGWMIWTAFDFPLTATCIEPDCPGEDSPLNHYGIWSTSYFPKLAVEAIQQAAGISAPESE